jgi:hypothetical protein
MKLTEHDRKTRALKLDIERFMAADYPSGVELATAPLLSEWSVVWLRAGDRTVMKVEGLISGDPLNHDGDLVRTAPIAMFDREQNWVRTVNTFYRLGQQAGTEIGFEDKL